MYEKLRVINPSPFTELNCSIAMLYVRGASEAIKFLEQSRFLSRLRNYYLYHAVLGKIYAATGDRVLACESYKKALARATQRAEQTFLQQKVSLYSGSNVH